MNFLKKAVAVFMLLLLTLSFNSCSNNSEAPESTASISQSNTQEPANTDKNSESPDIEKPKALEPNKPLFTDIFFADPSAHVFNDKLYIYPSHDIDSGIQPNNDGDQYAMEDYHVLSIDDFNSACIDNGQALHLKDVPWAKRQMWAPDAAYKNNMYYLYFPAKDKDDIFRIGVATSTSPIGPFTPEKNYIQGSFSMDPAVFTDDDNKSYMYFGGLWGGQLEKWKTGTYDSNGTAPQGSEPALGPMVALMSDDMLSFKEAPQEVSIVDENGNPILASDEDRRFFEGAWVHKYNDNYYLSYSTGTTHYIVYAMSKNPKGPFTYKGRILNPVTGWTTHHSIVEFKGKWYLFYHDASLSGVDHKRSVMYTELSYNSDGTIIPVN
ncbi:MAG TPA: glycoside hydrolase family 43 protein [Pseudobacteroides sp.]|nr:glycoside hydrolase family 43 protein [Pseudobacteroides sp.]